MLLSNLINYVKTLNHTIDRNDISTILDDVFLAMNEDVIPSLNDFIKNSELPIIKNSAAINFVLYSSSFKAKDNGEMLILIRNIFTTIYKNNKVLKDIVMNELPEHITDSTMTVKQAAIIKTVADINAFITYTMDFLYYITINGESSDSSMPDIKIKQIKDGLPVYANMVASYVHYDKIIKELPTYSDALVMVDNSKVTLLERVLGKTNTSLAMLPNANGITGVIYWFRIRLADRDISELEAIKEKKRLLELKLLDLKTQANNEPSDKLDKAITYYEEKISKIEYDVARKEEKISK